MIDSGIVLEYSCERCGIDTPNGAGHYPDGIAGDRVCGDCLDRQEKQMQLTRVTTAPCRLCGVNSVLDVPSDGLALWRSGKYVQDAFPDLSVDDRELLVSGTHPECWNNLFPKEES